MLGNAMHQTTSTRGSQKQTPPPSVLSHIHGSSSRPTIFALRREQHFANQQTGAMQKQA